MLAFSHSMIFHSYPHITSVFIHAGPMLLSWGLRWFSDPKEHGFGVCAHPGYVTGGDCFDATSAELVARGLRYFYVPWIMFYYTFVFVLMGTYIRAMGFQTLYDRVTGQCSSIHKFSGISLYFSCCACMRVYVKLVVAGVE